MSSTSAEPNIHLLKIPLVHSFKVTDIHNKVFLPRPFAIGLISLPGSLVHPHPDYGMQVCLLNLVADTNCLEQIQRLSTRLVIGLHQVPHKDILHWRWVRAGLKVTFKVFTGLLDVYPSQRWLLRFMDWTHDVNLWSPDFPSNHPRCIPPLKCVPPYPVAPTYRLCHTLGCLLYFLLLRPVNMI